MKVSNDPLQALNTGPRVVLVLLDLSAAFDTLDCSILLHGIENVVGRPAVVGLLHQRLKLLSEHWKVFFFVACFC